MRPNPRGSYLTGCNSAARRPSGGRWVLMGSVHQYGTVELCVEASPVLLCQIGDLKKSIDAMMLQHSHAHAHFDNKTKDFEKTLKTLEITLVETENSVTRVKSEHSSHMLEIKAICDENAKKCDLIPGSSRRARRSCGHTAVELASGRGPLFNPTSR